MSQLHRLYLLVRHLLPQNASTAVQQEDLRPHFSADARTQVRAGDELTSGEHHQPHNLKHSSSANV
jgi:hypothetical protein